MFPSVGDPGNILVKHISSHESYNQGKLFSRIENVIYFTRWKHEIGENDCVFALLENSLLSRKANLCKTKLCSEGFQRSFAKFMRKRESLALSNHRATSCTVREKKIANA